MTTRRTVLAAFAAAPIASFLGRPALAAQPPVFSDGGLAIRGFDPVAYFTQSAPVMGSAAFQSDYMGATWRFASAASKALF
ncbi:MAG: YHS domain protein, partial [Silicimonas sp.]|nr:YHS domain protein [Silicimonas sp.]